MKVSLLIFISIFFAGSFAFAPVASATCYGDENDYWCDTAGQSTTPDDGAAGQSTTPNDSAAGQSTTPNPGVTQNKNSALDRDPIVLSDPVQKTIPQIFEAILDIIMVFAIPIIVFFIVWAGFLYVTATGNPEKIKKAHNALLYALIGGLIVLGANVILAVITNTINVFK